MKYEMAVKLLESADKEFQKKDVEKGIFKRIMFCYNGELYVNMEGSFNSKNLKIISNILERLSKKITDVDFP